MTDFRHFIISLRHSLTVVRGVLLGLLVVLTALGVLVAWAEELHLSDALYFTLITGLTVGYGDISPVTSIGRIASVMIALAGLLLSGIYIAVATKVVSDLASRRRQMESKRKDLSNAK